MTERRSSREEGRANETTKRRGGTLRQGRSWTRRYIPPLHQAWQPPNPPTNAATDCAQPGAATHLRSDMCLLPVPRTRHSKRTPGRDESTMDPNSSSLVPVPRPSPFASHPQEVGQKKKRWQANQSATRRQQNVSSRRVSWLPANATSRRSPLFRWWQATDESSWTEAVRGLETKQTRCLRGAPCRTP